MQKAPLILLVCALLILFAGCLTQAEEWNRKGETHHTMGRYEEAVIAFDKAVALDPGYTEAWRNRGLSLALLGNVNASEESFSRALSLDPDNAGTYYYQALSRNVTGDRQGALESLDRAVSFPPGSGSEAITLHKSLMLRGDLLSLRGRTDEANASYRRAHEVLMSTI